MHLLVAIIIPVFSLLVAESIRCRFDAIAVQVSNDSKWILTVCVCRFPVTNKEQEKIPIK